jgi:hypothetical protein
VITAIAPVGLACSSRARNACQWTLFREGTQQVTACPSRSAGRRRSRSCPVPGCRSTALSPGGRPVSSPPAGRRCVASPVRTRRRRSPWCPPAGACSTPRPAFFWPNSGSALVAQERGRRQRTPSASRIRRTWERAMSMPAARAAAVSASRVHTAGPVASVAVSSPVPSRSGRPSGGLATRAISWERWAWPIRLLRPAPGRSPSPSSPSAAKRASRWRTAFWLHPSAAAMAGTRHPSQNKAMICARWIQSPGPCRAPASLRILRSSTASIGGRANSSFGMVDHHHGINPGHRTYPRIQERSTGRAGHRVRDPGPHAGPGHGASVGAARTPARSLRKPPATRTLVGTSVVRPAASPLRATAGLGTLGMGVASPA